MLSMLMGLIPGVGPVAAIVTSNWKLIVGGIAAVAIGLFVFDWHERGVTIAEQQTAIATLQNNLKVAQDETLIANAAKEVVVARLQDAQRTNTNVNHIIEGARHAPSTSNAPLAPVLRDSLAGVAGLRKSPAK